MTLTLQLFTNTTTVEQCIAPLPTRNLQLDRSQPGAWRLLVPCDELVDSVRLHATELDLAIQCDHVQAVMTGVLFCSYTLKYMDDVVLIGDRPIIFQPSSDHFSRFMAGSRVRSRCIIVVSLFLTCFFLCF